MNIFERIEAATDQARSTQKTVELSLTQDEWDAFKSTTETVYAPSAPPINTGPSAPLRVVLERNGDRIYISV